MWGPQGASVAYVFGANIYYRETPETQDAMVTTSGRPGVVFNGVADWVYEEEVLSDTKAIYFSPTATSWPGLSSTTPRWT